MRLADVLVRDSLSPQTVFIADTASSAAEVISRLAGELAALLSVDRDVLQRAVMERERARTTAFSNGAAIPHCRLPGLRRFGIAVMILHQPVRWDNDGRPVDTIMMIAGPTDQVSDHLRILANSSQLLDSKAVRGKLKTAPDANAAYELLSSAEAAVEQRRTQDGMLREIRKEDSAPADYLSQVAQRFNW
jgi:PTS system nitrogen regulatory IIA component